MAYNQLLLRIKMAPVNGFQQYLVFIMTMFIMFDEQCFFLHLAMKCKIDYFANI